MKTLVEVIIDYDKGTIKEVDLNRELLKLNIYTPNIEDIISTQVDAEDIVWSIGDGNSWLEATALLDNGLVSRDTLQDVNRRLKELNLL